MNKLPLTHDGIFVKNTKGEIIFNWLFLDDRLKNEILECLNTGKSLSLKELSINPPTLSIGDNPILLMRCWDYLVKAGLPLKEAIKVQNDMLKEIYEKLKS